MEFATFPTWFTFGVIVCVLSSFAAGLSDDVGVCDSSRTSCDKYTEGSTSHLYEDISLGHDEGTTSSFRYDSRFRGEYTFSVEQIPRMECEDPGVTEFFERGSPAILEGCAFANPALKWDLGFLKENLRDENHSIFISPNHKFLYYDEGLMGNKLKWWSPPTKRREGYFEEFLQIVDQLQTAKNGSHAYFQSPLVLQEGVSSTMKEDVESFDYSWLLRLVGKMGWGEDVVNLLLVGMPNVVTPAHYDILENLFVQLYGRKRCILFSPEFYPSLYAFPVGHPHDRQTQVDFDSPDFHKFPRFREIQGMEAVVGPGDVLYIPNYWWHYIESESNNMTISLNFWFEPKNSSATDSEQPQSSPEKADSSENENDKEEKEEEHGHDQAEAKVPVLSPADELALTRSVEISLFRATRDHEKVKRMLEAMLVGRFTSWDQNTLR